MFGKNEQKQFYQSQNTNSRLTQNRISEKMKNYYRSQLNKQIEQQRHYRSQQRANKNPNSSKQFVTSDESHFDSNPQNSDSQFDLNQRKTRHRKKRQMNFRVSDNQLEDTEISPTLGKGQLKKLEEDSNDKSSYFMMRTLYKNRNSQPMRKENHQIDKFQEYESKSKSKKQKQLEAQLSKISQTVPLHRTYLRPGEHPLGKSKIDSFLNHESNGSLYPYNKCRSVHLKAPSKSQLREDTPREQVRVSETVWENQRLKKLEENQNKILERLGLIKDGIVDQFSMTHHNVDRQVYRVKEALKSRSFFSNKSGAQFNEIDFSEPQEMRRLPYEKDITETQEFKKLQVENMRLSKLRKLQQKRQHERLEKEKSNKAQKLKANVERLRKLREKMTQENEELYKEKLRQKTTVLKDSEEQAQQHSLSQTKAINTVSISAQEENRIHNPVQNLQKKIEKVTILSDKQSKKLSLTVQVEEKVTQQSVKIPIRMNKLNEKTGNSTLFLPTETVTKEQTPKQQNHQNQYATSLLNQQSDQRVIQESFKTMKRTENEIEEAKQEEISDTKDKEITVKWGKQKKQQQEQDLKDPWEGIVIEGRSATIYRTVEVEEELDQLSENGQSLLGEAIRNGDHLYGQGMLQEHQRKQSFADHKVPEQIDPCGQSQGEPSQESIDKKPGVSEQQLPVDYENEFFETIPQSEAKGEPVNKSKFESIQQVHNIQQRSDGIQSLGEEVSQASHNLEEENQRQLEGLHQENIEATDLKSKQSQDHQQSEVDQSFNEGPSPIQEDQSKKMPSKPMLLAKRYSKEQIQEMVSSVSNLNSLVSSIVPKSNR